MNPVTSIPITQLDPYIPPKDRNELAKGKKFAKIFTISAIALCVIIGLAFVLNVLQAKGVLPNIYITRFLVSNPNIKQLTIILSIVLPVTSAIGVLSYILKNREIRQKLDLLRQSQAINFGNNLYPGEYAVFVDHASNRAILTCGACPDLQKEAETIVIESTSKELGKNINTQLLKLDPYQRQRHIELSELDPVMRAS